MHHGGMSGFSAQNLLASQRQGNDPDLASSSKSTSSESAVPEHHKVMAAKFTGVYPVRNRFRAELCLPPLNVFVEDAATNLAHDKRRRKIDCAGENTPQID